MEHFEKLKRMQELQWATFSEGHGNAAREELERDPALAAAWAKWQQSWRLGIEAFISVMLRNEGDPGSAVCATPHPAQGHQDATDARRWRAVRKRHASVLCQLATGSSSYSSNKAPALLDAWADMAVAEIEAFDPEHWLRVEVPARLAELEREDDAG